MSVPRYEVIKQHVVSQVEDGHWLPGDPVPSENQLAEDFSVSRMTARRALTELTEAGVLERTQGAGTFVAEQMPTGSLLEIRSIDDEIHERGHRHIAKVISLTAKKSTKHVAAQLGVEPGSEIFYSKIVHFEENTQGLRSAIQIEERYVNQVFAPDYLLQDFEAITPSAYLTSISPLSEADHWVEAVMPNADIRKHLAINAKMPCLKLSRRTFSFRNKSSKKIKQCVNFAVLYHPGDNYRLGGHLIAN